MWCLRMFKTNKLILIIVIVLGVLLSGCTGDQDVTPIVKALPEVQQFMKEHPNAKITVTYWSKDEVVKSIEEISYHCDKAITPAAMYKAVVSEGDLKIVSWIDAENNLLICSVTEGKGGSITPTVTPTPTPTTSSIPTPTITVNPTLPPTVTPTATPTVTTIPTPTITPTPTHVPDFEVKIYDPEKDRPAQTIELVNWKAMPDDVSMRPGETVLIKVVNYPDNQEKPKFILGVYQKILGTSEMIVIKFNNRGTYDFTLIIPNKDPSILPVTYAKGSIKIY